MSPAEICFQVVASLADEENIGDDYTLSKLVEDRYDTTDWAWELGEKGWVLTEMVLLTDRLMVAECITESPPYQFTDIGRKHLLALRQ